MSRSSRRSDVRLRGPGGLPAALDAAYLLLELGAAAEQQVGQAAVQAGREPHHQRQGDQGDRADDQVEHDLGVPAVAEAEQLGQGVLSSGS